MLSSSSRLIVAQMQVRRGGAPNARRGGRGVADQPESEVRTDADGTPDTSTLLVRGGDAELNRERIADWIRGGRLAPAQRNGIPVAGVVRHRLRAGWPRTAPRPSLRGMSLYDIPVITIDGHERTLDAWRGRVLLVANVASRCGYTPQYAGLEALHRRHADAGLTVLGFPCDQFGGQEPGDEAEIARFCRLTYDVTFPLFAKVDVNGPNAHPLFEHLKAQRPGLLGSRAIKWNFTKFLVDRDGRVVRRYAPKQTPEEIERDVVALL